MDIEVLFYRKLNDYYQKRDYLYTLKSFRGHAYSIIDFLFFIIFGTAFLILGIVISFIEMDWTCILLFAPLAIIMYLISFLIFNGRKKRIKELNDFKEELSLMIVQNNGILKEKKLDLQDYINELVAIGFELEKKEEKKQNIYILKGKNGFIKIISKNTFFINSLKCEINGVNFKKCVNTNEKLMQLIKDYRLDSPNQNYYQMLSFFYKYILETLEDYF